MASCFIFPFFSTLPAANLSKLASLLVRLDYSVVIVFTFVSCLEVFNIVVSVSALDSSCVLTYTRVSAFLVRLRLTILSAFFLCYTIWKIIFDYQNMYICVCLYIYNISFLISVTLFVSSVRFSLVHISKLVNCKCYMFLLH